MIAIIKIPDHYKNIPQEYYNLPDAVRHGKILPSNATNGDVIKALFPDYTYVGTCVLDKYENILLHDVNYNWWNAPYTKEQNND